MKLGKAKLRRILSKETGIPVRDIIDYGRYENLGNKERLVIGAHTIIAKSDGVSIIEPVFEDNEMRYKIRIVGGEDNERD